MRGVLTGNQVQKGFNSRVYPGGCEIRKTTFVNTGILRILLYHIIAVNVSWMDSAKYIQPQKGVRVAKKKNKFVSKMDGIAEVNFYNYTTKSKRTRVKELQEVTEALKINTTVTSLGLSCNFEHEEDRVLGDALQVNSSLKQLDLRGYHLGPKIGQFIGIGEALQVNSTLTKLE